MEGRVDRIAAGHAGEAVWLLEHPPLYTAGIRAVETDIIADPPFKVYRTGRGGQYTYHGPGQRVAYVMLDLKHRNLSVHGFVRMLENWIVGALDGFGISGKIRAGRTGVWVIVDTPQGTGERKIAAIGIRLRRWISFHGIAINVAPDLGHYEAIVPCGIRDYGVTSLSEIGVSADMAGLDRALKQSFESVFGI